MQEVSSPIERTIRIFFMENLFNEHKITLFFKFAKTDRILETHKLWLTLAHQLTMRILSMCKGFKLL